MTAPYGVTQSVTESVTHFLRHTRFGSEQWSSLYKISGVYIMPSRQKWTFLPDRGFDVCPLVRGDIGEHDKNEAKGS